MNNTIQHFRAGQSEYIDGRQSGTVAVWHDSQLWLYPQSSYPRKGMRSFIRAAFGARGASVKIFGGYPCYTVETTA